jgi:hypothetical protein
LTPHKGLEVTVGQGHKVNAAEALFGSIAGALGGRDSVGDKFINGGWTTSHVFHQPMEVVEEGMGVGVESHSIAVTLDCRRSRLPSLIFNVSCKAENRPMAAGMARSIDCSSPITCCHFVKETRRWEGAMEARISRMRANQWAGKEMVLSSVSIIQSRINFVVAQEESPFAIFLVEAGSWRWADSSLSKG